MVANSSYLNMHLLNENTYLSKYPPHGFGVINSRKSNLAYSLGYTTEEYDSPSLETIYYL